MMMVNFHLRRIDGVTFDMEQMPKVWTADEVATFTRVMVNTHPGTEAYSRPAQQTTRIYDDRPGTPFFFFCPVRRPFVSLVK